MKLLLQNNPIHIKPTIINPITGIAVPDWMFEMDELTIAARRLRRNGKTKFIEGLILDDMEKGINKEWERVTIFGTGGEEPIWSMQALINNNIVDWSKALDETETNEYKTI